MKIIDFEKKGNVVRFYLGADNLTNWYGDDWDDVPYEHNAGIVYEEFIAGHKDIAFPFDSLVIEPCEGMINSDWCKDDMVARRVPCIIVIPKEIADNSWYKEDFTHWVGAEGIQRFYFGDKMEAQDAGVNYITSIIDNAPTINGAPVVHARWAQQCEGKHIYKCSACGAEGRGDAVVFQRYCPKCGARMDKDEQNGQFM